MVVLTCKQNGKSSVVLQFAFQTHHPGLQNVALTWIHISTWCTYFILHFQMVSTRCKRNGKSTVVLHFVFQTHHPGLRNVAPIWIHSSTWCTFCPPTFANGASYMFNLVTCIFLKNKYMGYCISICSYIMLYTWCSRQFLRWSVKW